ncbi:MAG: hypothetical protein GY769_10640, partial [bacterium]|nr:hypothetical protein [bacterium]
MNGEEESAWGSTFFWLELEGEGDARGWKLKTGEEIPWLRPSSSGGLQPTASQLFPLHGKHLFTEAKLTLEERLRIIERAIYLLEEFYVHRDQKRVVYGVDPVLRLKALSRQLESSRFTISDKTESGKEDLLSFVGTLVERAQLSDLEFHREMLRIFTSLRDFHTLYKQPKPFSELVAFLPFSVERAFDEVKNPDGSRKGLQRRYLVTHVRDEILKEGSDLVVGRRESPGASAVENEWEVELWNGRPIELAVERNSVEYPGSNTAARDAWGLEQLTTRPLITSQLPDEFVVTVQFRVGEEAVLRDFYWLVASLPALQALGPEDGSGSGGPTEEQEIGDGTLGLNVWGEKSREHAYQVYQYDQPGRVGRRTGWRETTGPPPATEPEHKKVETLDELEIRQRFQRHLAARSISITGADGSRKVGYLRIFSFADVGREGFRDQVKTLLTDARMTSTEGLILDLRGNTGGNISAAESILQLLTPREIAPARFQLILSPLTRNLTRFLNGRGRRRLLPNLERWSAAADSAATVRETYSRAIPITRDAEANDVGQVYFGPCVLVVEATVYSAADICIA